MAGLMMIKLFRRQPRSKRAQGNRPEKETSGRPVQVQSGRRSPARQRRISRDRRLTWASAIHTTIDVSISISARIYPVGKPVQAVALVLLWVAMEISLYLGPILVRGLFFFWPIKNRPEKERIKKELRKSTSWCGMLANTQNQVKLCPLLMSEVFVGRW